MAINIENTRIHPDHQLILDQNAVVLKTITDKSALALKGDTNLEFPTLAPRVGQNIAVGAALVDNVNNYGTDTLALDRVLGDSFTVEDHIEQGNVLDGFKHAMQGTVKAMAFQADDDVLAKMIAAATAGGAALTADYYADLVDISTVMDIAKIPHQGRFMAATPADYGKLLKTKEFIRFDAKGDGSAITTGILGTVAGFSVVRPNSAAATESIFYIKEGAVYAWAGKEVLKQASDVLGVKEAYSLSRRFGSKATQAGKYIFKISV